jgi:phosphatidylglycerophosphatase C
MMSRNNSVVVFDLDGTLTRSDTYVGFLIHVLGKRPHKVFRLPLLAINVLQHKLGQKDNTWLKKRFLSDILAGYHRTTLSDWADSFTRKLIRKSLHADALEKLNFHLAQGDELVLLTASLDLYVEHVGRQLGFDTIICTQTSWINGILEGDLLGDNCYGENKLNRLQDWLDDNQDKVIELAYADHESDLPVLETAKTGVVINPSSRLADIAKERGLEIQQWN